MCVVLFAVVIYIYIYIYIYVCYIYIYIYIYIYVCYIYIYIYIYICYIYSIYLYCFVFVMLFCCVCVAFKFVVVLLSFCCLSLFTWFAPIFAQRGPLLCVRSHVFGCLCSFWCVLRFCVSCCFIFCIYIYIYIYIYDTYIVLAFTQPTHRTVAVTYSSPRGRASERSPWPPRQPSGRRRPGSFCLSVVCLFVLLFVCLFVCLSVCLLFVAIFCFYLMLTRLFAVSCFIYVLV